MSQPQVARISRIAAIQLAYSMILNNQINIDSVHDFKDINKNFLIMNNLAQDDSQLNIDFIRKLISYSQETKTALIQEITLHLNKDWHWERMPIITKIILELALSELLCFDTAVKILIDEYTTISTGFVTQKEVGFINGVLHNICHKLKK